jgi:hypothetical protein
MSDSSMHSSDIVGENIPRARMRTVYLLIVTVYILIGIVYLFLQMKITGSIFATTRVDYFNYLLDAFVHGRVNVITPSTYDLSLYHHKWYLYWGPAPVLLLWPFYLLWGVNASDVLYTLLGGFTNIVLSSLCVQEVRRYFNLSLSPIAIVFLLISFAFGSPNFVLSLVGGIWASSQIFAMVYLLLYYLFFFKYLNSGKQYYVLVAVVFFCLACLSRYSLCLHGLLFCYLLWDRKVKGKKLSPWLFISAGATIVFFGCLMALYNYLKFQNILEIGQRFQQGAARYDAIVKSGPVLSFSYLWHNVYYYFLNPITFSLSKWDLQIDLEGNSVLMVYPSVLLCSLLIFKFRQFDLKRRAFVLIVGLAALLTMVSLLLYFSTGWTQFGNRYFFDAFPLFFLLVILVLPYISEDVQWWIITWEVVINLLGAVAFFSYH